MLEYGAREFVGARDAEFVDSWRASNEVRQCLVEACGAPGGRPPPHGAVSARLHEPEAEGIAKGGGEPSTYGGFVAGVGVAVGPGDGDGGVVWVCAVVGLDGGGHGLF